MDERLAAAEMMLAALRPATDGLVAPTGWRAPTLAANWSDFGGAWAVGRYKRFPDGVVRLRGMIQKSVAVVAGETVFTLPPGFRPLADEYFVVNSSGAFGTVYVTSAGAVNVQVGNNTYVSLSGIAFDTRE